MKRLYFIVALFISPLVNCYGQYTTIEMDNDTIQRELLAEYFLCVCITEGFKDKQVDELDISQAVYFDILRYSPEAFQEIKDYAKEFVKTIEPSPIKDLSYKKAIILDCIEKYKSEELDKFIKFMDQYLLLD